MSDNMGRLTRRDLTHTVVDPGDVRRALNDRRCGYCDSKPGKEHEAHCVCRTRPVLVELRVKVVLAMPAAWDKGAVEFKFSGSSYCTGNLIGDLAESDNRAEAFGCCDSCSRSEVSFLRPATDEDIERYALLGAPQEEQR